MDYFNSIFYGNPTTEQLKSIQTKGLVCDLFDSLIEYPLNSNNSEKTKNELNEIAQDIKILSEPENIEYLNRYKAYDKGLVHFLSLLFKEKNIEDFPELAKDIIADINPLITKLKFNYQRPRPYQLAHAYELNLFPYPSNVAQSPSFPSGHALQAFVILNVVGNKFVDLYDFCQEIIEDVCNSRVYLGLHYPSDNEYAKFVGNKILKHPEFTKKYKI